MPHGEGCRDDHRDDAAPGTAPPGTPNSGACADLPRDTPGPGGPDSTRGEHGPARSGEPPARTPAALPKRSVKRIVKRTLSEFTDDQLTDRAAALTYYGVLSVFPATIALVSVLGLIGEPAVEPLADNLGSLAPGPVRDLLTSTLDQVRSNQDAAGVTLAVGIVLALWSASGYVAAFMRSANAVYDIGEGRPVWKTLPVRFGITVAVVVILALVAAGVVFTGTLARRMGEVLGLGDTAVTVWNYAKWPVIVLLIAGVIALLYWAAPNVKRGFSWVAPGGLLAVLIWIAASALFGVYVAHIGSYDTTYGSLAGVIVFLVWLWISNIAILLGLEFNAELERERALRAGHPPQEEPYAEPRDTRKL